MGEIKGDSKWVRSKERVGVWVGTRRWGSNKGDSVEVRSKGRVGVLGWGLEGGKNLRERLKEKRGN